MSLTVPTGGVVAGRAAELRIEAPQTGQALSALGEKMLQAGQQVMARDLNRQMDKARLTAMQGFSDLSLQLDGVGTPEEIGRRFDEGSTALREQVMASVDPRIAPDVNTMFDELALSHGQRQGARALDLRQSERRANAVQMRDTVVRTAAGADAQTRATYLDQYRQTLQSMVADGSLTPEEAQRAVADAADGMDATVLGRMIEQDPSSALTAIDSGDIGQAIAPERLEGLRAEAQRQIKARAALAATEQKRADGEFVARAKADFRDGIGVLRAGGTFRRQDEVDALLADPRLAETDEAREYASAKQLAHFMPEFSKLSPADKRRVLADLSKDAADKPYDLAIVSAMKADIAASDEAIRRDPYAHADSIGLKAQAAPLPDPKGAATDDLVTALRARAQSAAGLQAAGLTGTDPRGRPVPAPFFRPNERDEWRALTDKAAAPDQRARAAMILRDALGEDAARAAVEIGADGVFVHQSDLLSLGGRDRLARETFDGQRAIDSQDVKLPAETEMRGRLFTQIGTLFDPDEKPVQDRIIASTMALYAARARGNSEMVDGKFNETVFNQAFFEQMGGEGTFDDATARGGVATIKGAVTALPPDITKSEAVQALDALGHRGGSSDNRNPIDWAAVSATGATPLVGGEAVTGRTWAELHLRSLGGDAYALTRFNEVTQAWEALWGDDGHPFVLDLRKAVGKAREPRP